MDGCLKPTLAYKTKSYYWGKVRCICISYGPQDTTIGSLIHTEQTKKQTKKGEGGLFQIKMHGILVLKLHE